MDWTDGYVNELDYTHGYYRELAPAHLDLACISRGVSTLLEYRPLRYLELAFGQGMSVNIHAAACQGEFWGIDFNPTHAINARDLATASGSGAQLFDDSFEDFAARDDVPEFDVITMHGTWSWISPENRHLVVEILRRKLAPGGVFYMSYNCWPGWATEMPLRHLLTEHAELASAEAPGLIAKIDAAMEFAQSLVDSDAKYFRVHPGLKDWLEKMRKLSRNYLAHEYFNRDWHPMPSSEVARALSAAKLTFATSATLGEHIDGLGLPEKSRKLLEGIKHPLLRETVLDFIHNQRFRRDIFVKGPRTLHPAARNERLRSMPFMLVQHPDHVPMKVAIAGGEAELHPDVYRPFIEAMAEDGYAPKTLRQLEAHPKCAKLDLPKLTQAALMLTGAGSLHPAQPPSAIEEAAPRCAALNERILDRAAVSDNVSALASPVIGAGVFAARQEMLFIRAIQRGHKAPEQWAQHAWECLEANGQRLVVADKALETPAENLARLNEDAEAFSRIRLPALKALRIA